MQSVLTNDNEESLFAYSNENQSASSKISYLFFLLKLDNFIFIDFSSNDTLSTNVDSDFTDLFDALLTERQLVQSNILSIINKNLRIIFYY